MQRKYAELGHKEGTKNIKNFRRILQRSKLTVYAEKYAICTLSENMQNMLRSPICIKSTCLNGV